MPELLSPGVYVQELAGPRPVEPVGTSTAAFFGPTLKGKPGKPVLVSSVAEFETKFGALRSSTQLGYAIRHFFQEGGAKAYVLRVAGSGGTAGHVDVTDGAANAFTATAESVGTWANSFHVRIGAASNVSNAALFSLEVIKDGVVLEAYDNLSVLSTAGQSYIGNALAPGKSEYIEVTGTIGTTRPVNGTYDLAGAGDDGAITWNSTNINNALANLDPIDNFSMLVGPDLPDATAHAVAADYCDNREDCFYIAGRDIAASADLTDRGTYGTKSRRALYVPFLKELDPYTGAAYNVTPAGAVAGVYARTDNNRGVFKAPAGKVDGSLSSGLGLTHILKKADQDALNPIGVNVIRNFSDSGNVVWGARTLSGDPQWKYVNVRRLLIFIEESIKTNLNSVVFEPNTPILWGAIIRDVSGFLRSIWADGGLFGKSESEAFFVKVDETNNPASSRALGRLIVDVGVAPALPAEFILIRVQQQTLAG